MCGVGVGGTREDDITGVITLGSSLHNKVSGRMLHLLRSIATTFCIYYTYFQKILQLYFLTFQPRILQASSDFACQHS